MASGWRRKQKRTEEGGGDGRPSLHRHQSTLQSFTDGQLRAAFYQPTHTHTHTHTHTCKGALTSRTRPLMYLLQLSHLIPN